MSACGQDVMCSDTRACALGQEHGLIMSACAVGTVKSVGKGTMCDEMLSQLKEVASSLLERRGVVFSEGSTVLPQRSLQKESLPGTAAMESASASDARSLKDQKKEMEQLREALKENTEGTTLSSQQDDDSRTGTQRGSDGSKVAASRDAGRQAEGIPQYRGRPPGTAQGSNGGLSRPRERRRRECRRRRRAGRRKSKERGSRTSS